LAAARIGGAADAPAQARRHDEGVQADSDFGVDLYWLPLGAGGHSVRLNGRVFEALAARIAQRRPCDLYHSALIVRLPQGRFVIEMTPVPRGGRDGRSVTVEGAVGSRWARRLRIFRYEVHRSRDGVIPDVAEAVDSPQRLTSDPLVTLRLYDLVRAVPSLTWGRDEAHAGEMWNSNSVTAWLVARSGIDAASLRPPEGGRAPGWRAGLVVAGREQDRKP
jgi:hypothetical protein